MDPVSFAEALAPYAGLVGCVVLCACHGANLADRDNVLGSVAQRLHRVGFPAVVASRAALSSAGAEGFAAGFYDTLLAGEPLHRAVAAGRRRLGAEWAGLQFFARAKDGPQYPVMARLRRPAGAAPEAQVRGEETPPGVVAGTRAKWGMAVLCLGVTFLVYKLAPRAADLFPEDPGKQTVVPLSERARQLQVESGLVPGKCLDAPDGTQGVQLIMWRCHDGWQQQFSYNARNGELRLRGSGLCLNISGGMANNGDPVILWPCTGGTVTFPNQSWRFEGARLVGMNGKCLDSGSRTDDGSPLIVWACHDGATQRWLPRW